MSDPGLVQAASQTPPPHLTLLSTLSHPSGTNTRTWQSSPHPSPTSPLLATASSDKSIHIWSLRDFRLLSSITGGHKRSVRCVGWKDYGRRPNKRPKLTNDTTTTPQNGDGDEEDSQPPKRDPTVLATGSFDANVGIWIHNDDYGKPKTNPELNTSADQEMDMTSQTKDADEDEEWHFSTLLTGPDSEIKSLCFSPPHYSANLLATSSRDKSVWVWEEVEPDEWETIAVLQEHTGDVKCVAWCRGAPVPDEDEESGERVVGSRELLASGSYDDTIRLWRDVEEEGDWMCVGVIDGHSGTVWCVAWEPHLPSSARSLGPGQVGTWEPRLASCSDDLSIRLWRRQLSESEREKQRRQQQQDAGGGSGGSGGPRMPSILRPASSMETWVADAVLPAVHVRSVYALDWSARSGLIVSCGGDGAIAVYREDFTRATTTTALLAPNGVGADTQGQPDVDGDGDVRMDADPSSPVPRPPHAQSRWMVVALVGGAHNEFEVNHVCWALRRDGGKVFEDEEVIVSTGDDGAVKIWTLPEGVVEGRI